MTKKLPEHLRPLADELSATFKDGRFITGNGSMSFKTAKEAVEHNKTIDNWLGGFIAKPKPLIQKRKPKTVASPKDQHLFNLNFEDELNGIRSGLKQIEENKQTLREIQERRQQQTPVAASSKTSSGLNYLMGFDDE